MYKIRLHGDKSRAKELIPFAKSKLLEFKQELKNSKSSFISKNIKVDDVKIILRSFQNLDIIDITAPEQENVVIAYLGETTADFSNKIYFKIVGNYLKPITKNEAENSLNAKLIDDGAYGRVGTFTGSYNPFDYSYLKYGDGLKIPITGFTSRFLFRNKFCRYLIANTFENEPFYRIKYSDTYSFSIIKETIIPNSYGFIENGSFYYTDEGIIFIPLISDLYYTTSQGTINIFKPILVSIFNNKFMNLDTIYKVDWKGKYISKSIDDYLNINSDKNIILFANYNKNILYLIVLSLKENPDKINYATFVSSITSFIPDFFEFKIFKLTIDTKTFNLTNYEELSNDFILFDFNQVGKQISVEYYGSNCEIESWRGFSQYNSPLVNFIKYKVSNYGQDVYDCGYFIPFKSSFDYLINPKFKQITSIYSDGEIDFIEHSINFSIYKDFNLPKNIQRKFFNIKEETTQTFQLNFCPSQLGNSKTLLTDKNERVIYTYNSNNFDIKLIESYNLKNFYNEITDIEYPIYTEINPNYLCKKISIAHIKFLLKYYLVINGKYIDIDNISADIDTKIICQDCNSPTFECQNSTWYNPDTTIMFTDMASDIKGKVILRPIGCESRNRSFLLAFDIFDVDIRNNLVYDTTNKLLGFNLDTTDPIAYTSLDFYPIYDRKWVLIKSDKIIFLKMDKLYNRLNGFVFI